MKSDRADHARVQELIQTLKHAGAKQAQILKAVNQQLSAENQRAISLRTLQRMMKNDLDKPDVNSLRELIESLVLMGTGQATILEKVNAQLNAQSQRAIGSRMLQHHLQNWGLDRKSQHAHFFYQYYEEISELFLQGVPGSAIIARIKPMLANQGYAPIGESTLYSYLKKWGFDGQACVQITDELVYRVQFYFFSYGYCDQSILRDIVVYDKMPCTLYAIRKIRYQYGMKRRFRTEEERTFALQTAIEFLDSDIDKSMTILSLGRKYLYNYVRQKCQVLVSQNRLYDYYRSRYPGEVASRTPGHFKYRKDFYVPGPNFLWCLDGYEKLKAYGFQVYACIDAYSRFVIWIYVGRSATTALSTLKQYLRTTKALGMRPYFTRSDRGVETPLWVAAQATLAAANVNTYTYEDTNGNQQTCTQGSRIDSCHLYGESTRNIRIESWWRQLRKGCTDFWISYFARLCGQNLFRSENYVDQIALYAVYGPMIQGEIGDFVDLWNGHSIRNQRNRAHVVSGKPADLWRTQDAPNCGVRLSEDVDADDRVALNQMLDPLEAIDIDRFLVQETEDWCNDRLQEMGFFEARITDRERPHEEFYKQLQRLIQDHEDNSREPVLQLAPIPRGGLSEYMRLLDLNGEPQDPALHGSPIPAELQELIERA
ncbi:hypothetical protein E4U51_008021 [Claviceps purpurea]|nr:hypothetical protein E4U51_008021 [Claviceps purpurea]